MNFITSIFFSTEDDYWYNIFIDSSDGLQHMHYTNNPFGLVLDFIAGEPLSIQDYNSEKFKLYPNPATDRLFIKSKDAQIIKTIVYSISGKRILEGEPIEGALDITSLANGMYFLELTTSEGHRSVVKFIKK